MKKGEIIQVHVEALDNEHIVFYKLNRVTQIVGGFPTLNDALEYVYYHMPEKFLFNPIQVVSVEDTTEVVFKPDEKLQKKLDDKKPTNVIPFKRK